MSGAELDEHVPERSESRARRTSWPLVVGAVVVIATIATIAVLIQSPQGSASEERGVEVSTAVVTRGDLVERVRVKGTLGHGGLRDLGTSLGGIVTGVTKAGAVVGRGQELFRIDDRPVVLFFGDLPAWRAFESGMDDGPDVLQLERNLAELGFFDREPDEEFSWYTMSAIYDWQESLGLEETGTIELGRIVFSPGELRVAEAKATVGDAAGSSILAVSGTVREVTAFLDPNLAELAAAEAPVELSLPDGTQTTGTVIWSGAPVEKEDGTGGKALKIPVRIALDDPEAAGALDNVSLSIVFSLVRSEDGLLVPVLALLAQPGGGFAVERLQGEAVELVAVELGPFADGFVEVTGGGLAAGDEVVVGE